MSTLLAKKSILKKTLQVSGSTAVSRVFALVREYYQVPYMGGASAVADAFRSAWMLPNMLRQIFAEGALSAAVVPTVVKMVKEGKKDEVNSLMALSFLVFEGAVLAICAFVFWKAEWIIYLVTPGYVPDKAIMAARFLRILMPFIFFISSSALLAGALQSMHHFWAPAIAPVIMNIIWVSALLLGVYRGLAIEAFCFFILFAGLVQCLMHVVIYFRLGFTFSAIDTRAWQGLKSLFKKFLPCTLSGGVLQLSLVLDTAFASYLPDGSVTLLSLAQGFLRIPLGIFAVAFSTILLPHFSRVSTYAPKRLSFYLLESSKLTFWITLPTGIMLSFFSEKIFLTLFHSSKFTMIKVLEAKLILMAFLLGLFFLSMNKILTNIYYSQHQMWLPAFVVIGGTAVNFLLNYLVVYRFQATGLAIATSVSSALQTVLFVALLHIKFNFRLYHLEFLNFLYRYVVQLVVVLLPFYALYRALYSVIEQWLPTVAVHMLTKAIGFWVWSLPLCLLCMLVLYKTKRFFKVHLYFLK